MPAKALENSPLHDAARRLAVQVNELSFSPPVTHVYNPLDYAWAPHSEYLSRFGQGRKRVVFLGMNPGPYGMTQTGVPFGEVRAARDWLGIRAETGRPEAVHPKRPVSGFACTRSEVSGRRLWGFFSEVFDSAPVFFEEHFVLNYCPLVFMSETGSNITPDKLIRGERDALDRICDAHLREALEILDPEWAVGIGGFAEAKLQTALEGSPKAVKIGRIPHPSPANPAANRGWSQAADEALRTQGIW